MLLESIALFLSSLIDCWDNIALSWMYAIKIILKIEIERERDQNTLAFFPEIHAWNPCCSRNILTSTFLYWVESKNPTHATEGQRVVLLLNWTSQFRTWSSGARSLHKRTCSHSYLPQLHFTDPRDHAWVIWLGIRHRDHFYPRYQTRTCVLSLKQGVMTVLNLTALVGPEFALKAAVCSLNLVQLTLLIWSSWVGSFSHSKLDWHQLTWLVQDDLVNINVFRKLCYLKKYWGEHVIDYFTKTISI